MATFTQVTDMYVPEISRGYGENFLVSKNNFFRMGIAKTNPFILDLLKGPGKTFKLPSFNDLPNVEPRTNSDAIPHGYTGGSANPDPSGRTTALETAVRLSRNQSWASTALAAQLAGADPLGNLVGALQRYWAKRAGMTMINIVKGILADNAAAPAGSEHVQNDLTVNKSGSSFAAGTTNISGSAVLDALESMGDHSSDITVILVHSAILTNLRKANLVATIPPSEANVGFETYFGRRIYAYDGMPKTGSVYDTWMFGDGFFQTNSFVRTTEDGKELDVEYLAGGGNGGGASIAYQRCEFCFHPVGHSYIGTTASGEPKDATLAGATAWKRVYPDRKQIKLIRLVTREA